MDKTLEKENPKNPMLLSPVIRCVLKFLNIEETKNCRLISRDWGSTGKLALAARAQIYFHNDPRLQPVRRPVDFYSCFLDSTTLFSAFQISGVLTEKSETDSWHTEELTNFFEQQHKYIKELTLWFKFSDEKFVKSVDVHSWISKYPLVQKDSKYMTKLSISFDRRRLDIPLHLISEIYDLTLSNCKISLEPGIKFCNIKLELAYVTLYLDGIKLDRVRINDFVDICTTKHLLLRSSCSSDPTKCVLDLSGRISLDKLTLENCEIVNGETSQWVIQNLVAFETPFSLNRQMQITSLYLSKAGTVDLFALPTSIQKLGLQNFTDGTILSCSQPIVWENLKYINISKTFGPGTDDYSFLSHFANCPQLTHLKMGGDHNIIMNPLWMPKSVKTVTLEHSLIKFVGDNYLNVEKLVICSWYSYNDVKELCQAKILVDDVFIRHWPMTAHKYLVDFLEYRNRFSFGKRIYIGQLDWDKEELEFGVFKKCVEEKSSFYVFKNEEKGRPISKEIFFELMPKHPEVY